MKYNTTRYPADDAGCFSLIFLAWMNSLLRLGSKRPLNLDDLFPLPENHKTQVIVETFEEKWKDEVLRAEIQGRKPRLWRAMFQFLSVFDYLVIIALRLGQSLTDFSTPVFLWYYLKLLLDDDANVSIWYSIGAVAGIVLSCNAKCFLVQHNRLKLVFVGMQLKVACIGVIYKKVRMGR